MNTARMQQDGEEGAVMSQFLICHVELTQDATVRLFRTVQKGGRKEVARLLNGYRSAILTPNFWMLPYETSF